MKWFSLFSKINNGEVTIKHLSTSSLIEIELDGEDGKADILLTYRQFDDLIECIEQLTNGKFISEFQSR